MIIFKLFKKINLLLLVICFFSLDVSVRGGYQLGGDTKVEEKKVREILTPDDFGYPMAFNNDIYDFVTVAVYGTAAPGSGVIIAQNDNDYYVLTANHVVGEVLKGDEIEVQTLDGEYHLAELLQADKEIDGALIKFSSTKKYYKTFIHPKAIPSTGMYILTQGYALASKEAKKGSLRRSTGPVLTVIEDNRDGYDIFYGAATNVGMSGGGVFTHPNQTKSVKGEGWSNEWLPTLLGPDDKEKETYKKLGQPIPEYLKTKKRKQPHPCFGFSTPILVGIHGRAESYRSGGKSGASMGMSVHTLLRKFGKTLAAEGVTSLPDERETAIWKDGCHLYPAVQRKELGDLSLE